MANIYELNQSTKDNIGTPDDTKSIILVTVLPEYINIEEGPTKVNKKTYSGADGFILNHAVYGVLGTATLGEPTNTTTLHGVVNPKNTFHEHYRYTTYNDTTVTTGSFDTTNFCVELDSNEIYQTLEIYKDVKPIFYATTYVDLNGGSTTFILSGTSKSVSIIEGKTQNV